MAMLRFTLVMYMMEVPIIDNRAISIRTEQNIETGLGSFGLGS